MVKRKISPKKGKSDSIAESSFRRRKQQTPSKGQASSRRQESASSQSSSTRVRKAETPKKLKGGKTEYMIKNKRFKVSLAILRDIRDLQRNYKQLLIPKLPFARLFREILQELGRSDYRVQVTALQALQESAEYYLTYLFEDCNKLAGHAKRATVFPSDMGLVLDIRGMNDPGWCYK